MKIVRIYPKTNFHTYLHSDTLWGNLVYAYRMIYGIDGTSELLNNFKSEIPFKVTSIFPLEIEKSEKNGNTTTYYLPKPIIHVKIRDARNPEEMTYLKDFKKIRYIDKKTFEEYLSGETDDNSLFERFLLWQKEMEKKESERNKKLIEEKKFKFKGTLSPSYNLHNSIDRMSGSTLQANGSGQLYWEEEFSSIGNKLSKTKEIEAGIYFLVDGKNTSLIEAPLRLLSHIGIGGNKSIGKGSFDYKIENFSLNQPNNYNSFVSLSLFQPNNDELNLLKDERVNLFYDLTTRFGKVGRDFNLQFQDKNPVICFTEGSTFFVTQQLSGRLISTAKFNDDSDIYSNYLFYGVKANLRLQ